GDHARGDLRRVGRGLLRAHRPARWPQDHQGEVSRRGAQGADRDRRDPDCEARRVSDRPAVRVEDGGRARPGLEGDPRRDPALAQPGHRRRPRSRRCVLRLVRVGVLQPQDGRRGARAADPLATVLQSPHVTPTHPSHPRRMPLQLKLTAALMLIVITPLAASAYFIDQLGKAAANVAAGEAASRITTMKNARHAYIDLVELTKRLHGEIADRLAQRPDFLALDPTTNLAK